MLTATQVGCCYLIYIKRYAEPELASLLLVKRLNIDHSGHSADSCAYAQQRSRLSTETTDYVVDLIRLHEPQCQNPQRELQDHECSGENIQKPDSSILVLLEFMLKDLVNGYMQPD